MTSSPSAPRRGSEAALLVLLHVAAPGCGAGAGAPCASTDECAPGLACRGGVCLPLVVDGGAAEDRGEEEDGRPAEDRVGETPGDDADRGARDEAGGDADDGDAADDGGLPPLALLDPGETHDPPEPSWSGVDGAAGESYVLVLWENGLGLWDRFDVLVEVDNGRKTTAAKVDLGTPEPPRVAATPCLPLRIDDPGARRLPDPGRAPLFDPVPGDTATFLVIDPDGTSMSEVTARLEHLGVAVEFWADLTNPFPDPPAEFYPSVAERFDGTVLSRERFLFHDEPDVDGNGRITVLVSPTVGALGASGYVNPLDLTTSPYGNHKDMIYLNPPSDRGGTEWSIWSSTGVLAHELQHLIRAGALGDDIPESIYFNEGMSHLAADLAGYGFDNLWFLGEFLDDPTLFSVPRGIDSPRMAASSDYREDITLRSAGYFLLRYLFDRLGGLAIDPDGTIRDTGGLDLLRTQFTGDLRGVAVLEAAVGLERRAFVPDWLTAMLLDGRTAPDGAPLATPRRFRFADPVTDPLTGVQNGIALNADNAYLDWGSVFLANVAPADLIDWDHVLYGGGIALLLVRPVAPGPVVARVSAEEGAEVGVRWVRIR